MTDQAHLFRPLLDSSGRPILNRNGRHAIQFCPDTGELRLRQGNHLHRWVLGEDGWWHPVRDGKEHAI